MPTLTITQQDVVLSLSQLVTGKTPGSDPMPVNIIKICRHELSFPLYLLYNRILQSRVIPSRWKTALVTPVHKKGDKNLANNYRPISITPIFSKVLEQFIHTAIYTHVKDALSPSQHGFVPRRSTVTNLAVYTHDIARHLNDKHQIDSIYTDFSTAFDCIDHGLLLHKLKAYNISDQLMDILTNYLSSRYQSVVVNGKKSSPVEVTSGVVQGSKLGPLLFILYCNDIPHIFRSSSCLMYADDLKIYRPINTIYDCVQLQQDINYLREWCNVWKLNLNIPKCKVISFCNKKKPIIFNYKLDNIQIDRCNHINDLGVIITDKLNYDKHINTITTKSYRSLGFIKRHCLKYFSLNTISRLYTTLVRPHVEYACTIWNPHQITQSNNIEKLQHRFVKWVCFKQNIPYHRVDYPTLCGQLNLISLQSRRTISDISFILKILNNSINVPDLLSSLNFNVPSRFTRNYTIFRLPQFKIDTFRFSSLNRCMRAVNELYGIVNLDISNICVKTIINTVKETLQ